MTVLGSMPVPEMESAITSVTALNQHPRCAGLGKRPPRPFHQQSRSRLKANSSQLLSPVMALRRARWRLSAVVPGFQRCQVLSDSALFRFLMARNLHGDQLLSSVHGEVSKEQGQHQDAEHHHQNSKMPQGTDRCQCLPLILTH